MYINYIRKLRYYIRKEGRKTGRKGDQIRGPAGPTYGHWTLIIYCIIVHDIFNGIFGDYQYVYKRCG